jgi:spermidine/putrescine transport system permease protein
MPKLRQLDIYLYEAALDLGCNSYQAFIKVVLPEIFPGILSGFLMAFTYSIDDFVISYFTTGPEMQTLPVAIFSMIRRQVSPEINALSAIMFVVVLALLIIMNVKDIRDSKKRETKYFKV